MNLNYIKKPNKNKPKFDPEVTEKVSFILNEIREKGDLSLIDFCRRFDGLVYGSGTTFEGDGIYDDYTSARDQKSPLKVSHEQIQKAYDSLDPQIIADLKYAADRIRQFAIIQKEALAPVEKEVSPGVVLGHRIIPINSCAAYVPGGHYPLPSSALMSIIPAKVAGVKRIVSCSPPDKKLGTMHPATLVAIDLAGADEIYCMGGAHAIAAFAYGTESIEPVDIIVGPGNQWVTEAKRQVSGIVGIDFLAGPSEVLIIADNSANSEFIAADLLAQSEHDPQARGILLTTDESLGKKVEQELLIHLSQLETADIAQQAWENNGEIILVSDINEAVELANQICPEHLELHIKDPDKIVAKLTNYGSLFIGGYSAEVFGDYISGTNHILPTMTASRYTAGVWVGTFLKIASFQKISPHGAKFLSPIASRLAQLEGLYGHKKAAEIRNNP
jgi:histidinol dehydrogenase